MAKTVRKIISWIIKLILGLWFTVWAVSLGLFILTFPFSLILLI